MRTRLAVLILLSGMAMSAFAQAELKEGDPLPKVMLKDQHDKPADIPPSARQLLFAADNAGAAMVTDLLDRLDQNWLAQTQRVYLADIHKMPGMISRLIALPRLREKRYPIVLGREETDLAMFPRKKDCVTVIPVQEGRVGSIEFACSAMALREAVQVTNPAESAQGVREETGQQAVGKGAGQ